jgi:NHL repeat
MKINRLKSLAFIGGVLAAIAWSAWAPPLHAQQAPHFVVDPSWPKPLPAPVGNDGVAHPWVQGEVAGDCVDVRNNVYTFNRGWEVGTSGLTGTTGTPGSESGQIVGQDAIASAIPSPPVVVFDTEGNTIAGWGNPSLLSSGYSAYMPHGAHGCFVDYQGYIWLGGNGDGIVQKYNPAIAAGQGANATYAFQIGSKGTCDDGSNGSLGFAGCGVANAASNTSHTLLNEPADIAVDPNPDPFTHTRGSVYIADGYGNHRVVVYTTSDGGQTYQYNRQWGQACPSGTAQNCLPGYFGASGGGHPHCVVLGNDGLIYVCDRPNNRIQVFQKTCGMPASPGMASSSQICMPVKIILVGTDAHDTPNCTGTTCVGANAFASASPGARAAIALAGTRSDDIDFWPNVDSLGPDSPTSQNVMVNVDLGNDNTWLWNRSTWEVFGALGVCGIIPCPGHNAGHFAFGHTTAVDSFGNIYVAETITGRRVQKFVPVGDDHGFPPGHQDQH